jgi:bacterioferritin-associated ferredoxin
MKINVDFEGQELFTLDINHNEEILSFRYDKNVVSGSSLEIYSNLLEYWRENLVDVDLMDFYTMSFGDNLLDESVINWPHLILQNEIQNYWGLVMDEKRNQDLICHCFGVTNKKIQDYLDLHSKEEITIQTLSREVKFGGGCRSCLKRVTEKFQIQLHQKSHQDPIENNQKILNPKIKLIRSFKPLEWAREVEDLWENFKVENEIFDIDLKIINIKIDKEESNINVFWKIVDKAENENSNPKNEFAEILTKFQKVITEKIKRTEQIHFNIFN